jgi:hypothetical protein
MESNDRSVMDVRRTQEHRKLTQVLNVALVGGTSIASRRAHAAWTHTGLEAKWVSVGFPYSPPGSPVIEEWTPPTANSLEKVPPNVYYSNHGSDGLGLRIPSDLDELILGYRNLPTAKRAQFDRAAYWLSTSSQFGNVSTSAAFAALVSAIESLTKRGDKCSGVCNTCDRKCLHEIPGPTKNFRAFLEEYVPEPEAGPRLSKMYDMRSRILHGSDLMQLDQDFTASDPTSSFEIDLHGDLLSMTRIALRAWLQRATD